MMLRAQTFKLEPYWWDAAPCADFALDPLPRRVDVAIVGSGFTGCSAALTLARAGRSVLIIERDAVGMGGSSRSQGQLGLMRHKLGDLERLYGAGGAAAIMQESRNAFEYAIDLIQNNNIKCHFRRSGRIVAAACPAHYEALAAARLARRSVFDLDSEMISRADIRNELNTDAYYGGELRPTEASLHGAEFHHGLLQCARDAGALIVTRTRVTATERRNGDFEVHTDKGMIFASDVLVGTDAYTDKAFPDIRRRIIPLNSGGIVTETLSAQQIRSVVPNLRVSFDTFKLSNSIRPSPDLTRIIFGGRATLRESDPGISGPQLYGRLIKLYPQLEGVRITHSWLGRIGYTFRAMPFIGKRDGVHYAVGYCGHGIGDATWLGHKSALRILGAKDATTAYDDIPLETRPLFYGDPWFLPVTVLYYRWLDFRAKP
jgi:glycine/D-amino acid oxidase-like deaminating enzyme